MKQIDNLEEVSDMREEVQREKDLAVQLSVAQAMIYSFNHSSKCSVSLLSVEFITILV